MDRINGLNTIDIGGGRRGFRGRNAPGGVVGTELAAPWLNNVQEELLKVITEAGLAPSEADATQLWQAIRAMFPWATFEQAGAGASGKIAGPDLVADLVQHNYWTWAFLEGTANALVATTEPAFEWVDSATLVYLRILENNTGPATINVNGLGVRPIVRPNGEPLAENDLVSGRIVALAWDGPYAATPGAGNWQLLAEVNSFATAAQVIAGTVQNRAVDPAKLAALIQSGIQTSSFAGGTANAITAVLTPAPSGLFAGMSIKVMLAATNTASAVTLNLNGLGAKPVKLPDLTNPPIGALPAGSVVEFRYDGTVWQAHGLPPLPSWWRLSSPSVTLASGVTTQVGSFGVSASRSVDNVINAATGAVTIGAQDAGLYMLVSTFSTTNDSNAEQSAIAVNGTRIAAQSAASPSSMAYYIDQSVTTLMRLAAGDVVTALYRQENSGSASKALEPNQTNHFAGIRIGS